MSATICCMSRVELSTKPPFPSFPFSTTHCFSHFTHISFREHRNFIRLPKSCWNAQLQNKSVAYVNLAGVVGRDPLRGLFSWEGGCWEMGWHSSSESALQIMCSCGSCCCWIFSNCRMLEGYCQFLIWLLNNAKLICGKRNRDTLLNYHIDFLKTLKVCCTKVQARY